MTPMPQRLARTAALIALTLLGSACAGPTRPDAPELPAAFTATLTREARLADPAVAAAIARFWAETGRFGEFEGRRGVRIAHASFPQPPGRAAKGAILIVAGRTESMLKYPETVHDLWQAGYAVHIHDHRGQGLSGREPETADTPEKGHVEDFDDYVEDLRGMLARVVLPTAPPRLFLLAHSMGGAITARFLESGAAEAARVDAALLSSPMLEITGLFGWSADGLTCRIAGELAERGKARDVVVGGGGWRIDDFKGNKYSHSALRFARVAEAETAEPRIRLGSPTHGWLAQACRASALARAEAGRIGVPLRVLVAGEDRIVHPDGPAEFCAKLRAARPGAGCGGPGGAPIVIEGAAHELFIESDPMRQRALGEALRFFADVAAGGLRP